MKSECKTHRLLKLEIFRKVGAGKSLISSILIRMKHTIIRVMYFPSMKMDPELPERVTQPLPEHGLSHKAALATTMAVRMTWILTFSLLHHQNLKSCLMIGMSIISTMFK